MPRPLVYLPDPRLRLVSAPVPKVTGEVRALADAMFESMYDAPGVGLAAIQIGEPLRVITMDLAAKGEPREPLVLINPEILWSSPELSTYEEGCLSIPDYYEDVERPAEIEVQWLDRDGAVCTRRAGGLFATCVQHELDHLNGVLFIDHISKLKRDRVVKKFSKLARREAEA